jgi:hypothetical protein
MPAISPERVRLRGPFGTYLLPGTGGICTNVQEILML